MVPRAREAPSSRKVSWPRATWRKLAGKMPPRVPPTRMALGVRPWRKPPPTPSITSPRVVDRGTSTKPGCSTAPISRKIIVPGAQAIPSFRNQETGVWAMKGSAAMVPSP